MRTRKYIIGLSAMLAAVGAPRFASGDPLPGEVLKFQQLPLNGAFPITGPNAPYPGHDEPSTAYSVRDPLSGQLLGWQGSFMADDFADRFSTPVVHVRWWGSYLGAAPTELTNQFLISFESDVPAVPGGPPSIPGLPLLNQIVNKGVLAPGSGTFTEKAIPAAAGNPEGNLFEYNAELNLGKQFFQHPDTVYWLKIVALHDNRNIIWGWHDRDWGIPDPLASTPPAVAPGEGPVGAVVVPAALPILLPVNHFQDDAVSGRVTITPIETDPLSPIVEQSEFVPQRYIDDNIDGPPGIEQFSKDLAFELYTVVPEPNSLALLAGGLVIALRRRR